MSESNVTPQGKPAPPASDNILPGTGTKADATPPREARSLFRRAPVPCEPYAQRKGNES